METRRKFLTALAVAPVAVTGVAVARPRLDPRDQAYALFLAANEAWDRAKAIYPEFSMLDVSESRTTIARTLKRGGSARRELLEAAIA